MVHEHTCARASPAALLRYSPDSTDDRPCSPEYIPVSKLWTDVTASAQQMLPRDEVVFGPGVQLDDPNQGGDKLTADISDLVNRMEIDATVQTANNGNNVLGTEDASIGR